MILSGFATNCRRVGHDWSDLAAAAAVHLTTDAYLCCFSFWAITKKADMSSHERRDGKWEEFAITKEHEDFESDGYVHYLHYDVDFMYVYICQNLPYCTL